MKPSAGSHRVLGIFAKQPIAGEVKTRLAQGTSAAWAQQVAQACLEDWLDRLAAVTAHRVIAHAPDTAVEYFSRWVKTGYDLFSQGDGDLGNRLDRFFRQHREQGFGSIIVVGSDSPTLPIDYIEQAFDNLETGEVVLGPSVDGGYYLIGSRGDVLPMFEGIPWSTSRVLERTVQRLSGVRLTLLPPWYDVDTVENWEMLRGHVLAMRCAGLDPGVPRIERLIQEQQERSV